MITIHNNRLEIQIQEPGSSYKRSRFDWSGICQEIILDGKHTFCSQEATEEDPGTEGIGLTDEFGITTPIGYDQIDVGEWFPKIGVGFLQKMENSPYDFMQDYPMKITSIEFEKAGDSQITFSQKSEIINGWGWDICKTLSVNDNSLTIDYALENCGDQPLITEQYNHNFVAIDGQTVGPGYELQTSFPIKLDVMDGELKVEENVFGFTSVPTTYIYALQSNCADLKNVEWSLTHQPSGHGLQVSEKFPLIKFVIWAKNYVISPEFFTWINLLPGETQTWQRVYNFF